MSLLGKLALSVLPAAIAALGGAMVYKTHEGREEAATIEGTEQREVADLQPGDGLVAVSGTARAGDDDLLSAAMLGTEGVVVRTVVEQRAGDEIGENRKTAWDTIYDAGDYVPFAVDDGTGQVAVEPPGGNVGAFTVDSTLYESEPGEEPPEPVRRWLDATDGVDAAVDQYRGYRQAAIEPGETVHVVGEPVDNGGETVLTGQQRPEEFVASDLSKSELANESTYGAGAYALGGLLVLVGAVPLALLWL
jgi:hypothetical protein